MNDASALRRLTTYTTLTSGELKYLAQMTRPLRRLETKSVLLEEGAEAKQCFLLLEGWVGSFSTSRHGDRTMTRIYMPGDLMASTGLALRETAETLIALCPVTIAAIPYRGIGSLLEIHPRLAGVLYIIAQEERVRQMDWIAAILHRPAAGRIATLLLNLSDRHVPNGGNDSAGMPFHLNQYDIADLTGLTVTHTNRVIQQFRRDEAITLRRHILTILRRDKLEELADRPRREPLSEVSWLPPAAH